MSLLAILAAIQATGDAKIQEIEALAYQQANVIRSEAHFEAERIRQAAQEAAFQPASRERARIIHRARLDSLQILGNLRESLVETALDQTRGRLAVIRTHPSYRTVLRRLAREALCELDSSLEKSGAAQIEADPRDQELLESILLDMGFNLKVSYTLHCWGGLIAKSQDSKVVVINTLDTRLERATPYLRHYLAAFFENQHVEIDAPWIGETAVSV